jgi:fructokinase
MIRIGVDFGGTKIEAAALDDKGRIVARVRRPNPGDYQAALDTLADLVAEAEAQAGATGTVGVGSPGSRSPKTGLMRNANSTWLNGKPFLADLQKRLGRDVRLANDADCMALSEATDGAGAGADVVFAAILGTGCGGGLTIGGALIGGANGVAGEWGHMPLPWPSAVSPHDELPAPKCWCGRSGCMELYASGKGLEADFARRGGGALTAEAIVARARAGEPLAEDSLGHFIGRLGRGLAVIVNILDPDVIVLAGGMSNVDELYDGLPLVIPQFIFSDTFVTPIRRAVHGDSSGVRGAAWLWPPP